MTAETCGSQLMRAGPPAAAEIETVAEGKSFISFHNFFFQSDQIAHLPEVN
jgi:hypothetical protein